MFGVDGSIHAINPIVLLHNEEVLTPVASAVVTYKYVSIGVPYTVGYLQVTRLLENKITFFRSN